jgi:hypothetical protein
MCLDMGSITRDFQINKVKDKVSSKVKKKPNEYKGVFLLAYLLNKFPDNQTTDLYQISPLSKDVVRVRRNAHQIFWKKNCAFQVKYFSGKNN